MRGDPGELVLGRYRIEHQIGRGGFGRIYLARQVALSRPVALKASAVEQRRDLAMRERFRREAVLVASIAHPNVVTYHDFGTDDAGDMILVMEYLRGRSLHEVARSGETWPLARVAEAVRQAAEGLFAAHQAGIVHRDVKPSNLFLIDAPTPTAGPGGPRGLSDPGTQFLLKVIDFGILRVDAGVRPDLPDLTAPEAVIGTPAYLAPEMLMGTRPDPRADQYALALVACELLTGRRAFGGPANPDSFLARVSRLPPELDLVPEGPASVLARALSPDRDARFPTVVDFARAFAASSGQDAAERLETTVEVRRSTVKTQGHARSRMKWAALVAGLASAVFLASWAWTRGPPAALDPRGAQETPGLTTVREPAGPVLSERLAGVEVPAPSAGAGRGGQGGKGHVNSSSPKRRAYRSPGGDDDPIGATERDAPGRLTVNARPWADVWLDGVFVGRTPVIGREVTAGSHTVRLVHPTLGARTVTRTVRSGESVTLTEALEPSAPPRDSRPGPRTP